MTRPQELCRPVFWQKMRKLTVLLSNWVKMRPCSGRIGLRRRSARSPQICPCTNTLLQRQIMTLNFLPPFIEILNVAVKPLTYFEIFIFGPRFPLSMADYPLLTAVNLVLDPQGPALICKTCQYALALSKSQVTSHLWRSTRYVKSLGGP